MLDAVADSVGDDEGRFDRWISEVEHAEQDLLRRQVLKRA
jgi:hypothetical protein